MARGINKVILVGNLGADPESRRAPSSGKQVVNFRVATSEAWRDKQSGEQRERTEWHSIVVWGRLAEIAEAHLVKGSQVYIEGKLQTRKWQASDGSDRYSTEVVAHEMQMLGGRPSGASSGGGGGGYGGSQQQRPEPPVDDFPDDDIPF